MSALLVAPAAAARQWSNKFAAVVALSGTFGAGSGAAGAMLSSATADLPTGPTIVLVATAVVAFSICFAPARGLVWGSLRSWRQRREVAALRLLGGLYRLVEGHDNQHKPHDVAALKAVGIACRDNLIAELAQQGWITGTPEGLYGLTEQGLAKAKELLGDEEQKL